MRMKSSISLILLIAIGSVVSAQEEWFGEEFGLCMQAESSVGHLGVFTAYQHAPDAMYCDPFWRNRDHGYTHCKVGSMYTVNYYHSLAGYGSGQGSLPCMCDGGYCAGGDSAVLRNYSLNAPGVRTYRFADAGPDWLGQYCPYSSGAYLLTPAQKDQTIGTVISVGVQSWLHPANPPRPPNPTGTVRVGFSIGPPETVLRAFDGFTGPVRLRIYDPANPRYSRYFFGNSLTLQADWDGQLYDYNGQELPSPPPQPPGTQPIYLSGPAYALQAIVYTQDFGDFIGDTPDGRFYANASFVFREADPAAYAVWADDKLDNSSGWTNTGDQPNRLTFDAPTGALRMHVFSSASARCGMWYTPNMAQWLPYTSVTGANFVRAKFYVYAQPDDGGFESAGEIPEFRLRVANRFAVSSYLEMGSFGASNRTSELRPSSDPANPSLYRVDMDPVDVPFLTTSSGEGFMRCFEAVVPVPEEHGYLSMTESVIGYYSRTAMPDDTPSLVKVYQPSSTDAGSLKLNTPSDLVITVTPTGTPGLPQHTEGNFGVTLNTANLPGDYAGSRVVGDAWRTFYAGADLSSRVRVEEGKVYKVRFHATSTQQASKNSYIAFRAKSLGWGWNQRFELGGAYNGGGGSKSSTIAQQALPGLGCLNPDKNGSEAGGWYNMIVMTPMCTDIRPEFAAGTPLSTRMPNICGQPGPGVNASSDRDLKISFELIDALSSSSGYANEAGNVTVDRIEVRAYACPVAD